MENDDGIYWYQNKLQGLGKTDEVVNMQSLSEKFISFGCETYNIDGHNFTEIDEVFLKVIENSNNAKLRCNLYY